MAIYKIKRKKTIKRLLFTPGFPPDKGGIQNFMLSRVLSSADEILVIAPFCPGWQEYDSKLSFKIIRFKYPIFYPKNSILRRFIQIRNALAVINQILEEYCFDYIELATAFPAAFFACVKSYPARKIIYTYGDDFLKPQKYIFFKGIFLNSIKRADRIISCSHFTADIVAEAGINKETIYTIYPPVNKRYLTLHDRTAARSSLGFSKFTVLLTVARFQKNKGIDTTLLVVAALIKKYVNLKYIIIGNGSDKARLKRQIEKDKLNSHVEMLHDISDEELPHYYAAADVFIMPTRFDRNIGSFEGYGIAFSEASSQKVPVIGPSCGGSAEAIINGKTGLLINPDNISDIRDALVRLLENPKLRKSMGAAGRRHALRQTDWSALAF